MSQAIPPVPSDEDDDVSEVAARVDAIEADMRQLKAQVATHDNRLEAISKLAREATTRSGLFLLKIDDLAKSVDAGFSAVRRDLQSLEQEHRSDKAANLRAHSSVRKPRRKKRRAKD